MVNGPDSNTAGLFVRGLLEWNLKHNEREMPWKGVKDPYKIWLSEIILQQTRVDQGLKYYQNFINRFPDVHTLAEAGDSEVFKYWEGLGYYSRCRNLLASARYISKQLSGRFPDDYESILELKGVGSYTAAAIGSFAFNLPYAVLDGNVYRVLSRIFNIELAVDSAIGKKYFSALSQQLLPMDQAGIYNQAIMDFGAVICKPRPDCSHCFFSGSCKAFQLGKQLILPLKEKKLKIRKRWLNYFIITWRDEILIRQRSGRDIWSQLYEFVLIETDVLSNQSALEKMLSEQFGVELTGRIKSLGTLEQKLTHQFIHFTFFEIHLHKKNNVSGYNWVKKSELGKFAFPRSLQQFASGGK